MSGGDCLTEEDVVAYVENAAHARRSLVERHLAACPDCGRVVAAAANVLLSGRAGAAGDTAAYGRTSGERRRVNALSRQGRWQIRRCLGEGGMGAVYEAFDHTRGEIVAVKTLLRADPATIFQFKQEFRSLAGVSHPNLVAYHELGVVDGHWFVTMEKIEGVQVSEHLWRERQRAGREAWLAALVSAMTQLAHALVALHRVGKLHRDVKPANLLVTPGGRAVLVDLGLVTDYRRPLHDARLAPGLVGTVAYMSPEQALGRSTGTGADWYAYGALLYQLLTGRPPFEGTPEEVLHAKTSTDPLPPSSYDAELPAGLDALCTHLLARDPRRRAGAAEVLVALAGDAARAEILGEGQFVGRDRELALLRRRWDEVRAGGHAHVHVHGGAGCGKTTLVRRFLAEAERHGAVKLEGRCYEGQLAPLSAIDELVDQLAHCLLAMEFEAGAPLTVDSEARRLAELFPVLLRVRGVREAPLPAPVDAAPARVHAALAALVALVATRAPLCVFVDDLQWGDVGSAGFLAALLGEGAPPLLLVLAHQGAPADEPLCAELCARRGAAEVAFVPADELDLGLSPGCDRAAS